MLDTGSFSNIITKIFLNEIGAIIDKSVSGKIIDINGQKKMPLGKISNVKIKINDDEWIVKIIVTESNNYNVILGNQWISQVNGILNYQEGLFSYESEAGRNNTLISCWQSFNNPKILYDIESITTDNNFELETLSPVDTAQKIWEKFYIFLQSNYKFFNFLKLFFHFLVVSEVLLDLFSRLKLHFSALLKLPGHWKAVSFFPSIVWTTSRFRGH